MRGPLSPLLAVALLLGLVSSAQAAPGDPEAFAYSSPGLRAVSQPYAGGAGTRSGQLTIRPPGFPSASVPARRLESAEVTQDLGAGRVRGTIVLAGVPDATSAADLHVEFGYVYEGSCDGDVDVATPTAGATTPGFTLSGRTITFDVPSERASDANWNCAFAALSAVGQPPAPESAYDVLIGGIAGQPELQISEVELLSSKVKKLKLVPKAWTTLHVTVANSGLADADGVVLGGKGKGLKIKGERLETVSADGGEAYGDVQVKLSGKGKKGKKDKGGKRRRSKDGKGKKGKPKLTLTASGGADVTSRTIRVKPIEPPPKPVSGSYESEDGSVAFEIRGGKVVGWRGRMQTRCGGYPDFPTYTYNTYDFPKVKIPANGIVDARDKGNVGGDAEYGVGLEMYVSGKRVTKGSFFYSGPARCYASTDFTAKPSKKRG